MNLVTQFLAARRGRLLMKLGCWLVCFSLVLGLMLPQQRAEAVGTLTIAAVASVAAAYLGACGMTFITQGMDKDALVSNVQRLIQEFLDTELGGITIQEWLGSVWNVFVLAGKIVMGRPLTEELVSFAQWVAGKYGAQVGENVIYSDQSVTFPDGSTYKLTSYYDANPDPGFANFVVVSLGTSIPYGTQLNPFTIDVTSKLSLSFYIDASCSYIYAVGVDKMLFSLSDVDLSRCDLTLFLLPDASDYQYPGALMAGLYYYDTYKAKMVLLYNPTMVLLERDTVSSLLAVFDLSIDRAPSMSYIPEGIKEGEGVALDVGAEKTMDLDQVCQGVLDDVIAGELTSTMTAADEKTEPVDPPAEELPDVGELGLPALGAALTSRFPFSIPWDFFRAVQLLAAPAKAPYFEVDFMEPLADEVGGWQGDTTVILDFSEYAIIGQISRWTSTIGFCLMLAGATKRLIWTA